MITERGLAAENGLEDTGRGRGCGGEEAGTK